MSFDFPDTMPSKEVQYATYIPARQPAFKVHNTQGLANSAVGQRNWNEPWAKYELQGGEWVKVEEYQPPTNCSICDGGFTGANGRIQYYTSIAKGAKYKKRPICANCYNTQRAQQRREQEQERDKAEYKRLSHIYGK